MKQYLFLFVSILGLAIFTSCEKEVDEFEYDELIRFQAYMSLHYPNLQPISESGLYCIIYEQGTGDSVKVDNYILYNYLGMNLDETVFETNIQSVAQTNDLYSSTSRYAPVFSSYSSSSLIEGLFEGISYLKVPAKARFIMPSSLAYGSTLHKGLSAYSSVIFDVELLRVIPDPEVFEQEQIDEFLLDYFPFGIQDTILHDGVYYLELEEGEGEYFIKDDEIEVNYIGRFVDGTVFDTNIKSVAEENGIYQSNKDYIPLKTVVESNELIDGFSLVFKKLRREGTAKVLITSSKAYGTAGSGNIRPYEPLVFDIVVVTKVETDED